MLVHRLGLGRDEQEHRMRVFIRRPLRLVLRHVRAIAIGSWHMQLLCDVPLKPMIVHELPDAPSPLPLFFGFVSLFNSNSILACPPRDRDPSSWRICMLSRTIHSPISTATPPASGLKPQQPSSSPTLPISPQPPPTTSDPLRESSPAR